MVTRSLAGRWGGVVFGLSVGGVVATACGGNSESDPPVTSPAPSAGKGGTSSHTGGTGGKSGGRAGSGGTSQGGMSGEAGNGTGNTGNMGAGAAEPDDPLAPQVEITSPAATTNPNGEDVIVTAELDVVCKAEPSSEKGAKDVDGSTALIDMLDGDGNVIETVKPTEGPPGVFTAHFITTKVPDNGVIAFHCSVGDASSPVHTGNDSIETFIDHGPTIEFVEPDPEDLAIPVGSLKVKFTVKEQKVASGDKGSRIGDVSMTVRDVPFDLAENDGEYTATVNLADTVLFPTTPNGSVPIVVTAGNQRKPMPAVASSIRHVIVDGAGPTLTVTQPVANHVIGGKVTLVFTAVDDQSGVDPDSIVAYLNTEEYRFSAPDWTQDGTTYSFTFDSSQIHGSRYQADLTVTAKDMVGNPSPDEAIHVYLDEQPPVVDLDPPLVREGNSTDAFCSYAFDPVGPLSANDLGVAFDSKKFRVLVSDQTNEVQGDGRKRYAVADLGSVVIRLQPNPEDGIMFDKSGDGICDELLGEDASLPALPMVGILMPGSSAWYGPSTTDDADNPEFPMPSGCTYKGTEDPPPGLCPPLNDDDMTRVIPWDVDETVPMIFGIAPDSLDCTGGVWEIGHYMDQGPGLPRREGWMCVAARAQDTVGNVGVSPPLRVCFDNGEDPPPACADPETNPPPSCTVDCTPPAGYPEHVIYIRN